jgi:hypothetical protein
MGRQTVELRQIHRRRLLPTGLFEVGRVERDDVGFSGIRHGEQMAAYLTALERKGTEEVVTNDGPTLHSSASLT